MEDRHVVVDELDCAFTSNASGLVKRRPLSLLGVFDGHGGAHTAQFVAKQLPEVLLANRSLRVAPGDALRDAFLAVDEMFMREHPTRFRTGTTAVCVLVDHDSSVLYVAHVGDTRAVLCRGGGVAVRLTQDHKPDVPAERRRIERAGGMVAVDPEEHATLAKLPRVGNRERFPAPRVYGGDGRGGLAVSRAIGDGFLKKPVAGVKPPSRALPADLVSAEPDVAEVPLRLPGTAAAAAAQQPGRDAEVDDPAVCDHFLIIASDGVWDVMDDDEAVHLVAARMLRGCGSAAHSSDDSNCSVSSVGSASSFASSVSVGSASDGGCARDAMATACATALCDEALSRGSQDNVCAVVMLLGRQPQ
jgi:serine/threonine protein phosphatase PrpC